MHADNVHILIMHWGHISETIYHKYKHFNSKILLKCKKLYFNNFLCISKLFLPNNDHKFTLAPSVFKLLKYNCS